MEEFKIKGDFIELIKLLKATGLCGTGGEAKTIVEEGLVLVNNEIELRKRKKLIEGDVVSVDEIKVKISK